MRPEAPFSRPVAICSCITALIRFRRSREKPACSGAAVGKLAPATNEATRQKTKSIRMSANLSQRQGVFVGQLGKLRPIVNRPAAVGNRRAGYQPALQFRV